MRLNLSNEGFTLIELLVILSLVGMVTVVIFSFMVSNVRTYNRQEDQLEVQYQAQLAMNHFTDKVMAAKNISDVFDDSAHKHSIKDSSSSDDKFFDITMISFNTVNSAGDEVQNGLKIQFNNHKLFYSVDNNYQVTLLADYIDNIQVKPEPIGTTFADCKSISVSITSKKNDAEATVFNTVYFRN